MTKYANRSLLYGGSSDYSCRKAGGITNTTVQFAGWESDDVCFREKSIREFMSSSYRKPTQVIWSSRPRYTGNGSLRNSAKKLSVSLSICSALSSSARSEGGHSKSLSTDCLAKTQAPANPNRGCIGAETCPVLVSQPSGLTYISPSKRDL